MQGEVALIHEQGQDFAILVVKSQAISSPSTRQELVEFGEQEFGVRTALVSEDGQTWGPQDIVDWLESVSVEQLPWRKFSAS
jgi:hypothetical protein